MKLSYDHDFRVSVQPEIWENEDEDAHLYEGIYVVDLNATVKIAFVPDVSGLSRPWSFHIPDEDTPFTSTTEARLFKLLTSRYSVTPDDQRNGSTEQIQLLPRFAPPEFQDLLGPDDLPDQGILWYVGTDQWPDLAAELQELTDHTYGSRFVRHSALGNSPLANFLNTRFLRSEELALDDLRVIGRA
ncbi:hypothetical protein [Nocardia australiensis]|uniref:hypothetical protein n=1 Tax=Nocardia australiensis TaxID=2887191 RepID=UPI001D15D37C|nr:hypothetical protein [Nocardia australiensis]